jgi:hypothetical protein
MSLILRGEKGSKLTTSELDNNLTYLEELVLNGGSQLVELTYNELVTTQNSWIPGKIYHITNFKTCYDQPNYNYNQDVITTGNYKIGETHSLMVLALANDTLSIDAWQPDYPKDKIKYDWTWDQTEVTGGTAFGRIIERIDEFNNRTDFDHREVKFVRYPFWVWDKDNPFAGTISVVGGATAGGMTVSGIGTNFNATHQPWNVISIPGLSGTFFFITEIISATQMVIESNLSFDISGQYNGLKYYWTGFEGNRSYYQSVLGGLTSSFTASEHLMFAASTKINNYFGDVANLVDFNEDTFLLPNNVLFSGSYRDNRFGNYCINNTFDDSCDGNEIGHEFSGNIITNDFDDNRIGNEFFGNVITGDFNDNEIGNFFSQNYIINQDFNDNEIGDSFFNNRVWGKSDHDFDNNIIGNNFENNEIYVNFDRNKIGYSFDENEIYDDFEDNQIGNEFNNNSVGVFNNGNSFDNNQIGNNAKGNNFEGDVSGNIIINNFIDNNILGDFLDNHIGNQFVFNQIGNEFINNTIGSWFDDNIIGDRFGHNKVGHYFYNNNIGDDFGYGGDNERGNIVGDYFSDNTIGEYCYDNFFTNQIKNLSIGDDFVFNDVKNIINSPYFELDEFKGNLDSITNDGVEANSSGIYTDITPLSGDGVNATFDIEVQAASPSGFFVTDVIINNPGKNYHVGDEIIIASASFNGLTDLTITVTGVTPIPILYTDTNCIIARDGDGNNYISYLVNPNTGMTFSYDIAGSI